MSLPIDVSFAGLALEQKGEGENSNAQPLALPFLSYFFQTTYHKNPKSQTSQSWNIKSLDSEKKMILEICEGINLYHLKLSAQVSPQGGGSMEFPERMLQLFREKVDVQRKPNAIMISPKIKSGPTMMADGKVKIIYENHAVDILTLSGEEASEGTRSFEDRIETGIFRSGEFFSGIRHHGGKVVFKNPMFILEAAGDLNFIVRDNKLTLLKLKSLEDQEWILFPGDYQKGLLDVAQSNPEKNIVRIVFENPRNTIDQKKFVEDVVRKDGQGNYLILNLSLLNACEVLKIAKEMEIKIKVDLAQRLMGKWGEEDLFQSRIKDIEFQA